MNYLALLLLGMVLGMELASYRIVTLTEENGYMLTSHGVIDLGYRVDTDGKYINQDSICYTLNPDWRE